MHPPVFPPDVRAGLVDLLTWRRDVRSFRREPLPAGALERLISIACLSPSVGLSEPWRFVVVEDPARRRAIRANFETANKDALQAQDESRRGLYARLKLAGLDEAPAQVAVFADPGDAPVSGAPGAPSDDPQGHGLGRRTMPNAIDHSVAIAIHTLWLAARLDGIGLGWVSILDPVEINGILDIAADWRLIGYLCLGYPIAEDDCPALQRAGWDARRGAGCRILNR